MLCLPAQTASITSSLPFPSRLRPNSSSPLHMPPTNTPAPPLWYQENSSYTTIRIITRRRRRRATTQTPQHQTTSHHEFVSRVPLARVLESVETERGQDPAADAHVSARSWRCVKQVRVVDVHRSPAPAHHTTPQRNTTQHVTSERSSS